MMNDPHLFTKFIIAIYAFNTARYLWFGLYGNAYYWFAAANITIAATWFMTFDK